MKNEPLLFNFIILEMNSFLLFKDNYLLIKNCILRFSIPKIFYNSLNRGMATYFKYMLEK